MDLMNNIKDFITQHKTLAGIVSLTGLGVVVFIAKRRKKAYNRKCGVDYPKNTVIVQVGFSKGKRVPTIGHFCLKLTTYMRAAGIPYKAEFSLVPGPKGKVPWLEYNDTVLGDSQFIINFCNKTFNRDLNQTLSKEERAHAWAIQKWIEEFLYWLNVHTRWSLYPDEFLNEQLDSRLRSWMLKRYLGKMLKKMTYMVGIGRHTQDEISQMIKHDLRQFSAILGNKKYVMGDHLTEVDCSAFGIIGQIYYQTPDNCAGRQLLVSSDDMQNVRDYLERIKIELWPDWDQLTMK